MENGEFYLKSIVVWDFIGKVFEMYEEKFGVFLKEFFIYGCVGFLSEEWCVFEVVVFKEMNIVGV